MKVILKCFKNNKIYYYSFFFFMKTKMYLKHERFVVLVPMIHVQKSK